MSESIDKNDELENEVSLDMSYIWYSDVGHCYFPPKYLRTGGRVTQPDTIFSQQWLSV